MNKFDRQSKNWDTESKINRSNAISIAIKNNIELKKNMRVLDFGCGTGLLSFPISNYVHSVHGVDMSSDMLKALEEKIKDENITTEFSDIFNIQDKFDLVISAMTLHHIEDLSKLAEKLYNLTHDNGIIAISDLMKEDGSFHSSLEGIYYKGFSNEFLINIFKSAGFKDIEIIENIFSIERVNKVYPLFLVVAKK